jgi:hypothetical protein
MTKLILGVDPGAKGAVAIYHPQERWLREFWSLQKLSVKDIYDLLWPYKDYDVVAVVERQSARKYQSSKSTFSQGYNFGQICAVLDVLQIPAVFPLPSAWKLAMKLTSDKERSLNMAATLFPDKTFVTHDEAEAALLAVYGALYL